MLRASACGSEADSVAAAMTSSFFQLACTTAKTADAADRAGRYTDAIQFYLTALGQLQVALAYEADELGKRNITLHTKAYRERVEALEQLQQQPTAPRVYEATTSAISTAERPALHESMEAQGHVKVAPVRWDDVIGLQRVKELLHLTVVVPREAPQLFTGSRKSPSSLLLYGPSGVGKTQVVCALATECALPFYSYSAAQLRQMYVGESEKHVKAMFDVVKRHKPCILFLDELDDLMSDRSADRASGSGNSAKLVNQVLQEMDGLAKDLAGVLVVGATNLPWDIDSGVLSRFERKIYIPLPDQWDRYALLRHELAKNSDDVGAPPTNAELLELASQLELYSGRELVALVAHAQQDTLLRIARATHCRDVTRESDGQQVLIACAPNAVGARALRYGDKSALVAQQVTIEQLSKATESVKPTVDSERLKEFEEWTREHGESSLLPASSSSSDGD